jgi:succinoglycan biosynthesis transport protein ExoP
MLDEIQPNPRPSMEDDGQSPMVLLGYYWSLVRKYYWIVLVTSILSVTAGYFWTKQQPKLYRTSSKIIFQNKDNAFGKNIDRVDLMDSGSTWQFEQFWNTQKEVLGSRWFLERVVKKLGMLEGDKYVPIEAGGKKLTEEARVKMAVGQLKGIYTFELQRDSRVAQFSAVSNNPEFAKKACDALASSYVAYSKEVQSGGLGQIVTWFDKYLGEKRTELNEAQSALHRYKRDNNILSESYEDKRNLTATNVEAVNQQMNEVYEQLTQSKAMEEQLIAMQKSGATAEDAARFTGSNMLIRWIESKRDLKQKLADLSMVYGPKHESVMAVENQLTVVNEAVEKEINLALSDVRNRVAYLSRQMQTHEARQTQLREDAFALGELGLAYIQLKDRAESLEELYKLVLERSKQLDINSLYESDSIRVLEDAELPLAPFSPNLFSNLGVALVFGLAFGGAIVFLIATLDNTVKTENDVTRASGLPLIGTLPEVDFSSLTGVIDANSLDTITHTAPRTSFAEGIKTLRTNLMFMSGDKPARMLLVTSPGPGEGKTLISSNMAIAMAQSGLKTLIVDVDLRRPRVHKALKLTNSAGVSDIVAGIAQLDDVIQPTEIENLFALPAGHIPPNPTELLHTQAFAKLIAELGTRFDRVIVDSPPIGVVADALILSRSVDGVLLVLKFGATRREMFRRSVQQLDAIGAPVIGCVLNDVKRNASGYGYSYYYYRYQDDGKPDDHARLVG